MAMIRTGIEAVFDGFPGIALVRADERLWNLHLTPCAGGCEGGNCAVTQITINRPAL